MQVCFQCNGIKYVIENNNQSIQTYLGSNVFTAPTQNTPAVCNVCLGTGINTQAGS